MAHRHFRNPLFRFHTGLILAALLLGACTAPLAPARPTMTATVAPVPPTAVAVPTDTSTPVAPTATATAAPSATVTPGTTLTPTVAADLATRLAGQLTPAAGTPSGGETHIEGVQVEQLTGTPGGQDLWLAYTVGLRDFMTNQEHYVAIYRPGASGWERVAYMGFTGPDYLGPGSVHQVSLDAQRIWIAVEGGMGAHAGYFNLLSFDGQTLRSELEATHESPGVASFRDLNGDGVTDVIVNRSERYVFCYACGVTLVNYGVFRWDGEHLVEVKLTPLPDSAPAQLRDLVNRAIELQQASLEKDALAAAEQAAALGLHDPVADWDIALIKLVANGQAETVKDTGYPLLENVFYGDYPAVLDLMRPHTPAEIFDPNGPLIAGTPATDFLPDLSRWLTTTTESALKMMPDLAPAHFLHGWGLYLSNPKDPQVLADVQRAAELAPDEPLYSKALEYLKGKQ